MKAKDAFEKIRRYTPNVDGDYGLLELVEDFESEDEFCEIAEAYGRSMFSELVDMVLDGPRTARVVYVTKDSAEYRRYVAQGWIR